MFILIIYMILPVWIFSICIRPFTRRHVCPYRVRDIQEVRRILRSSTLESRAVPNGRLVTSFAIDNAFTTTDSEYHRAFVCQAKDFIRTKGDKWTTLAMAAQGIVDTALTTLRDDTGIEQLPLVKFVQSLVFRIVIIKFFPRSDTPIDEDVEFITYKINTLWLASKQCSGEDPVRLLNDKKELLRKLNSFTHPQISVRRAAQAPAEDNPLNWILPAYETLWGVVLHCLLEVRFQATPSDVQIYKSTIEQFFNQPCQQTFETPLAPSTITVKSIVDETLRLYPPTRRINRQLSGEVIAIDIEYLHRDPKSWGDDSLKFQPGRWIRRALRRWRTCRLGWGGLNVHQRIRLGR